MEMIRYGILGCGKHAFQSHAMPAKEIGGLELSAICDISESQLEQFERSFGKSLCKFTNKRGFFESGVDAILIGTPDECHYSDLRAALEYGLHVFVEKPIVTKSSELVGLETLLNFALKEDLVVSSCHIRRFDPPFIWMKEKLPKYLNQFGNALELKFDFSYHRPTKNWKHNRGLLLDHVNHEIDLLSYLFGIDNFKAHKLRDTFDDYQVFGVRNDGIRFNFLGTRRLDSHKYNEYLQIRFEKGELRLDIPNGIAISSNHETNYIKEIAIPETDYFARGKGTMVNFVNSIKKQEDCYLSSKDLYVNNATSVMLTENEQWEYKNGSN